MWKLAPIKLSASGWCDDLTAVSGTDVALSLAQIIARDGAKVLGKRNFLNYPDRFPLRVKMNEGRKECRVKVQQIDRSKPRFTGNVLEVSTEIIRDYTEFDTFSLLICTCGKAQIRCGGQMQPISQGEIVLVSAKSGGVCIDPQPIATIVESYIR